MHERRELGVSRADIDDAGELRELRRLPKRREEVSRHRSNFVLRPALGFALPERWRAALDIREAPPCGYVKWQQ